VPTTSALRETRQQLGTAILGQMGSANLDLVRSIYAAWERDFFSSAEWAHPEIEFVIADGPAPGSWTGLAAMAEGTRDFLSAWDDYRFEVEDFRELDDEHVLVLVRRRGRGKTSGLDLAQMQTKGSSLVPRQRWQGDQDR
jgi:ketosteroid isomerase-like protein